MTDIPQVCRNTEYSSVASQVAVTTPMYTCGRKNILVETWNNAYLKQTPQGADATSPFDTMPNDTLLYRPMSPQAFFYAQVMQGGSPGHLCFPTSNPQLTRAYATVVIDR